MFTLRISIGPVSSELLSPLSKKAKKTQGGEESSRPQWKWQDKTHNFTLSVLPSVLCPTTGGSIALAICSA
jgi:hypothetical protein